MPYHTLPYHTICRSLSWLGHTCTWLCQPSPRCNAPAARLRRAQYIPSHLIPSRPIPSCQVTIPYHTIPYHTIPSSVEGCRSSSWLGHKCIWVCQPSPRRGAPAARLRRAQYIPSHLIPSRPIPSCQVTIPSHTIPSHTIPSSVEGCRSLSWLGHKCIWLCQPSPRCGAPAARLRRAQYIPSHLIPSRPIPSCQVTIPSHTIPYHLIPSSVEGCRSSSWLGHTCIWVCQPSPRCGAPAARLRRAQYIPSHLIPSSPIPSCQVTIPSHPIPYHLIPSSVEGCRSSSWLGHTCIWVCQPSPRRGAPAARLRRAQYIPSHLIPSRPIPSCQVTIPSHTISSHLVWKCAAARHGWGTHVSGCASPLPGVALLRHGSGAHNTSHPISSRPVQSHPVRSPSHTIPYHTISSHLVWKGAAARHGWGTHVPGCASPLPGVALLRHGCGAHNTSHHISSRPVQSHPVRSPSHPIPYHTISSHLVWKGAAACHGWGTHVSGCASPLPGVALLRHGSGAHNTSHPISSRPVQSHPVRSPSHPIPSHPI